MVICQFFAQGACRYGDKCWNEHPRGQQQRGFAPSAPNVQQKSSKDLNPQEAVAVISEEIKIWDKSKMWPFSCFSYAKEGQCLDGFEDISQEEIRDQAYTARKNGTFTTFVQSFNQLQNQYRNRRQSLMKLSGEMRQKLIQEVTNQKQLMGATPGVTGSAAQKGASPLARFSQTQPQAVASSVFGGGTQTQTLDNQFKSGPPNVGVPGFGTTASTPAVFGGKPGATPSIFGGNSSTNSVFGNNSTKSSFGGAFGGATNTGSVFGGSANTGANTAPASFGGSAAFGGQKAAQSAFGGQTAAQSVFGGGTAAPSAFGGGTAAPTAFGGATAAPTAFGGATAAPTAFGGGTIAPSAFGGGTAAAPSAFGGQTAAPSAFGGQAAPSVFGGGTAAPTAFGGNTGSTTGFGGSTTSKPGILGAAPTNPPSVAPSAFGGNTNPPAQSPSAFSGGANVAKAGFGTNSSTLGNTPGFTGAPGSAGTGLFGKPAPAQQTAQEPISSTVYTPLEALTPEERAAFESDTFVLGKIPTRPPPRELCR